jgi:2-(1,2-epoxy-1,2-dihydrophenyl)acetyl-CoA isomerase
MQYEFLDCEIRDGVANVALLGSGAVPVNDLCEEILDLMLRLQEDRAVRVILLTDGDGSFDFGPDPDCIAQGRCDGNGFESLTPDLEVARRVITIIQEMVKPVIAAARGPVRDSGLGFFLTADVRLASTTATFEPPDMSRGLLPDWGLTFSLPRLVGPGRTLEFIWSKRTLSAQEADRLGLVDRLLPDDRWDEELTAFLARLCDLPQPAVHLMKLAAQQASHFDMTAMLSYEFEAQQQCWNARETAEGMAAYLSGRSPCFEVSTAEDEED